MKKEDILKMTKEEIVSEFKNIPLTINYNKCYDCYDCNYCYDCYDLYCCNDCNNCYDCNDCNNCNNCNYCNYCNCCYMSKNLSDKKYYILNVKFGKKEYFEILKKLGV